MTLMQEIIIEAAGATWFAYGEFYGRGGPEKIRVKLAEDVMIQACDLAADGDDDALDDLFEKLGHNKQVAINNMWEDYSPQKAKKQIQSGKAFNAATEEFVFGYGKTAQSAKTQYLKIEDDDDDTFEE